MCKVTWCVWSTGVYGHLVCKVPEGSITTDSNKYTFRKLLFIFSTSKCCSVILESSYVSCTIYTPTPTSQELQLVMPCSYGGSISSLSCLLIGVVSD